MNEFFANAAFAGVSVSLISYMIGVYLKKKLNVGLFNPLLISIAVTIIFLVLAHIDYDAYNEGARYLSWLLTPATVCLAIPLYEEFELLKSNVRAVMCGIISGVLTSLITILVLALFFGLSLIHISEPTRH